MSMVRRLHAVVLLSALVLVPACEPDECSANFVLGGAIGYSYAWRHPSTECGVRSSPDVLGAGIIFETSGNSLEITTQDPLTVGSHIVQLSYHTVDGSSWTTDPFDEVNTSICVMTISASEVVDWVSEDHRRLIGLVDCAGGYLTSENNGDDLTVSALVFNVYTADNGYY
jgi:hypothetical protein